MAVADLTEALQQLAAAQDAKADFLEEKEMTEAEIKGEVTSADAAVADYTYEDASGATKNVNVYATADSDNVKAAKVTDQRDNLNKELGNKQDALTEAQDAVSEVSGLASAVSVYNNRVEALESAEAETKAAVAAQAAAKASYDSLNTSTITVNPDGTVSGLIVLKDDKLVLADNVTEDTNQGVTALLGAVSTRVNAQAAEAAASDAVDSAAIAIDYLDYATGDKDAMATAFRTEPSSQAAKDALTQAEVQSELNALEAGVKQLAADITAAGDSGDISALLTAAETAGYITSTQSVAISNGYSTSAAA